MRKSKKRVIYLAILFIILLCFFTSCKKDKDSIFLEEKKEAIEQEKEVEGETKDSLGGINLKKNKVFVHVCGAVKNPGVYELGYGSRVMDAVKIAGGFKKNAREEYLNLAELVEDQQKIYVPDKNEVIEDISEGKSSGSKKININKASKEELKSLTGIGDAKADAIIEYRENNGRYQKIEDIMKITGIKDAMFNKIKDNISVN